MIRVLFAAGAERWDAWRGPLERAFDARGLKVDLAKDHPATETDIIVYAPGAPLQDFAPYTNAKAVLNIWAGVEGVVGNPTLTQPFARMVDPGLTQGMVDYCVGHVLRHHLGLDAQLATQDRWAPVVPPLASDRPVTVLGLGALGSTVAGALAGLGFPVTGWARSEKRIDGVRCLAGSDTLDQALSDAQILVLLLPLTAETADLMDARHLALLPKGAVVINPGRGGLIVDADLLEGLDTGHIAHATLDTFRTEPLPDAHPFWAHPRVTITPHIASETRPETAASVIAENTERATAGQPLLHEVDKSAGY
ncbi:Glyoxylate/hydroxypyruvate reductase A [Rhodobacteraceae bacterium THAF1]|uniref:2-hydroxyacid dehydrogenase n=1 Tax=Palleronia sp. THAF1 TaxID=2587842 RepID=UPI000F3DDE0C|nr:glyoxylate/hydroxypyruvate reductase A [Palleronia sp. THAF1]QFU08695.1 Glyoxylate/hydroxypyruvate reductase A [Palleronia sp. THAF1]VDC28442.1 Glyoxylate/hydroxypyruvate reductase A [Rhodobacteraceae bacterium THAF1]